jgi:hypothetical protein
VQHSLMLWKTECSYCWSTFLQQLGDEDVYDIEGRVSNIPRQSWR